MTSSIVGGVSSIVCFRPSKQQDARRLLSRQESTMSVVNKIAGLISVLGSHKQLNPCTPTSTGAMAGVSQKATSDNNKLSSRSRHDPCDINKRGQSHFPCDNNKRDQSHCPSDTNKVGVSSASSDTNNLGVFQQEKQENSIKVNELKVLEKTENKKKCKQFNIESVLDSITEKLTKSVNSESLISSSFVQQHDQLTSLHINSFASESPRYY